MLSKIGGGMDMFGWVEDSIHRMKWFDMSLVKLSTAAFILLIAVLWPPLASLEWYWYLIIGIVAAARPMYVMFS